MYNVWLHFNFQAYALRLLVDEAASRYENRVIELTMETDAYDQTNKLRKQMEKLKQNVEKEYYLKEPDNWVYKVKDILLIKYSVVVSMRHLKVIVFFWWCQNTCEFEVYN